MAVVVVLLSAASHSDIIRIWTTDGSQGWRKATLGSANTKCDLSSYAQPCKGSPGPSPVGSLYMQCPQSQTNIGSAWYGNNTYTGTPLANITTLKYWTILDYRGVESAKTLTDQVDEFGNRIPMSDTEWTPSLFPTQPIQLYLYVRLADDSIRAIIYRPWSTPQHPGFGPDDGSLTRRWQEWDCLHEGYWLQEDTTALKMNTWSELLALPEFAGATLATPVYSATPQWGQSRCPVMSSSDPLVGSCLCFELGCRGTSNTRFPAPHNEWWRESYSALGAVDKFTIAGTDAHASPFCDEYDFQSPGLLIADPFYNKARAINNRAVFDQPSWVPSGRSRGGTPTPAWGGYLTANYAYLMNATQRAGTYNYDTPVIGRNGDGSAVYGYNQGHLFVLYGWVSDVTGDFFKVDDGSGHPVDCYCPNASTKPIVAGQFVRMLGSLYGQNPYEWYFNMFHVVTWAPDPANYVYSAMFPWRFDTYTWNVHVLSE